MIWTLYNITSSFIVVKTECSTLQQSVTQDSNQWHDCHAGQPQQPGLAQRLPETDGAKVLPTSDQVGFT